MIPYRIFFVEARKVEMKLEDFRSLFDSDIFSAFGTAETEPENIDYIPTKLVVSWKVSIPEVPPEPDAKWQQPTYDFSSGNTLQILYVELETAIPSINDPKKPKFHLHRALFQRPGLVSQILPMKGKTPVPIKSVDDGFPDDADAMLMMFGMPGEKITPPSKLHVFIRDCDTGEIHYCDPQVGNEPPGGGSGTGNG